MRDSRGLRMFYNEPIGKLMVSCEINVRAATFRGMRPLAKGDVMRCPVSRDKKTLRGASLAVRFIPRSVTIASLAADLEALTWGTRGSHEGVLGFDSGFEEPSKTPRTTFHGSPLDFNACTHAYVRECVRRFATEYARDQAIFWCTRFSSNIIDRLDISVHY